MILVTIIAAVIHSIIGAIVSWLLMWAADKGKRVLQQVPSK